LRVARQGSETAVRALIERVASRLQSPQSSRIRCSGLDFQGPPARARNIGVHHAAAAVAFIDIRGSDYMCAYTDGYHCQPQRTIEVPNER
jgi:hypothetical protein